MIIENQRQKHLAFNEIHTLINVNIQYIKSIAFLANNFQIICHEMHLPFGHSHYN